MSSTTSSTNEQITASVTTPASTVQTLAVLIAAAMGHWPVTLRFTVICLALSLPSAAVITLYLLIR